MSQWTHVAGMVRFDTIRHLMRSHNDETMQRIVEESVPSGSEGPCVVHVHENPMKEALAAFAVSIHGDLRDFGHEDIEEIETWMKGVSRRARAERIAIRQFVISAEVEGHGTYTWVAVTDGGATFDVRLVKTFEAHREDEPVTPSPVSEG